MTVELQRISNSSLKRSSDRNLAINPKLIFKIVLNSKGTLSEDQLQRLGLEIIGTDPKRALVVFPNEGALVEMRTMLSEYSGLVPDGHSYDFLSAIESIQEIAPEDRIGARLSAVPLGDDEVAPLDVELWHTGDTNVCYDNIELLRTYLEEWGGIRPGKDLRITDSYVGETICLVRVRLDRQALKEVISGGDFDFIKEVERRPAPNFELSTLLETGMSEISVPAAGDIDLESLVGVLIIDSGIATQHPLLAPIVGDAQLFPDRLRLRITGGAEDGDMRTGGHGTAVAGIAAYGDLKDCAETGVFSPTASIFSARVTDDQNSYDENELLEHQLEGAVLYFLNNYPSVRVINISLGNANAVLRDGTYQFRLAAAIDELAYRFRDREILFIVSAGNFEYVNEDADSIIAEYPRYLFTPEARIIDPASSAIALTIGGLSSGEGALASSGPVTDRTVAGEDGWPSAFTRSGWGFQGAIKPELVDFAGDLRFVKGRVPELAGFAGIPTTARNYLGEGRLFRTVAGTSFAAPRVANLASKLMQEFPGASSNLIRALLIHSARVPKRRPDDLQSLETWHDDILRIYGYGQPDMARARWSAGNDVLLLADEVMEVDTFRLFEIPSLPVEFVETKGSRHLAVTLTFDPPTRHTRANQYLGISMQFEVFRNTTPEVVAEALRAWDSREKALLEDVKFLPKKGDFASREKAQFHPAASRRLHGTAQHGMLQIKSSQWKYDGNPMILAVTCQRKWASPDILTQRFALVVSLFHEDPNIDLYNSVRQRANQFQKVYVRV